MAALTMRRASIAGQSARRGTGGMATGGRARGPSVAVRHIDYRPGKTAIARCDRGFPSAPAMRKFARWRTANADSARRRRLNYG